MRPLQSQIVKCPWKTIVLWVTVTCAVQCRCRAIGEGARWLWSCSCTWLQYKLLDCNHPSIVEMEALVVLMNNYRSNDFQLVPGLFFIRFLFVVGFSFTPWLLKARTLFLNIISAKLCLNLTLSLTLTSVKTNTRRIQDSLGQAGGTLNGGEPSDYCLYVWSPVHTEMQLIAS